MNLNDARRLAIRQRMNIRFTLNNGYEGLIDDHGIARIPGLTGPPDFALSDQFGLVEQFTVEPVGGKGVIASGGGEADLDPDQAPHQPGLPGSQTGEGA